MLRKLSSSLISATSLMRAQWWCHPRVRDAMLCCGMLFPTWILMGKCLCPSLLIAWALDPWTERLRYMPAVSITVSLLPPCPGTWGSLIYSLIHSNDGSAFSCLPLTPSFLQQGTAIPRRKNNGIIYIYNPNALLQIKKNYFLLNDKMTNDTTKFGQTKGLGGFCRCMGSRTKLHPYCTHPHKSLGKEL